ncbi:MAG TPA: hypothetical protein PLK76_01365 [bacterium]|nr:hypothetical protein [bacterium]
MNKKKTSGQIRREMLECYINGWVPPHKRKKKNVTGKFAAAYNGTYAQKFLNYRFRGNK